VQTIQEFLSIAHTDGIRVEALAGTHEWVENESGFEDGKAMCDAIVEFNTMSTQAEKRFDGIHFDVEHDNWNKDRWGRFMKLITHCQKVVHDYNQNHAPIVFGVDLPLRFWATTGVEHSGSPESVWDVLNIVDYITVMDYRDFASERWTGDTQGIIHFAEHFLKDGDSLGKDVIIGVELTRNKYDHVTFFEEDTDHLERELHEAAWYFSTYRSFQGLAVNSYFAWKEKVTDSVRTITAHASPGGTISPSGMVEVEYGCHQEFTIIPDDGYYIADVLVDGSSVGPVETYTFPRVNANRTIEARFGENPYPDPTPTPSAPIPEPTTLLLFGTGLFGVLLLVLKKQHGRR
jgi:hypothetical protein